MIESKRTKTSGSSRRIGFFMILFGVFLIAIFVKLFKIQIIDSSNYQLAAKRQYESKVILKPSRGVIYDRKLNVLVSNSVRYSYAADPNMIDNKDSVADLFSRVFGKDKNFYLDKLNKNSTSFVWLERMADPKYEMQLQGVNLSGVIKLNEPYRVFNHDRVAVQIIGSTDLDNSGISGIELEYNELLAGQDGYVTMQKDGLGRKRPAVEYPRVDPLNGINLVTTININVQKIVEEEIENGVLANDAHAGKCIVMMIKTGEILGMFSYLNENLEEGNKTLNPNKLTVVTDLHEPGSTFKLVTAAASLEEGLQTKNDIIETHGGEYQIYGVKFTDTHKSPKLSFQQVMEQSSNIGMMEVATKIGEQRFYKYARDFGFGITTGVEFPGEVRGILKRPVDFSPLSLRYMSIGYEVLVTSMQVTNAYACIANDGILMKPYFVKKEVADDGGILKEYQPTAIRTVVSRSTARTLTELLYGVVERGTGIEARIENVKIAGKTGTAQKLVDGKYSKQKYTSSFIGYFPAENPQIVVSVIIDEPRNGEYYGGKVAAPIFKKITERIISISGLIDYPYPNRQNESEVKYVSSESDMLSKGTDIDLRNFEVEDAIRILKKSNIECEIEGPKKQSIVTGQSVRKDGNRIIKIVLRTKYNGIYNERQNEEEIYIMPDLKGMSLRKCIRTLASMRLEFKINGNGKVVSHFPQAGEKLIKQQHIILICENSGS